MALTDTERLEVLGYAGQGELQSFQRGYVEALLRWKAPGSHDAAVLRRALALPDAQRPGSEAESAAKARSGPDLSSAAMIEEMLDAHPDADARAIRALIGQGIRGDQLGHALRLLDDGATRALEELREEAQQLREDLPGMFEGEPIHRRPAGPPDGRPGPGPGSRRPGVRLPESGVAAGREEAVRRGWATTEQTGGDAA